VTELEKRALAARRLVDTLRQVGPEGVAIAINAASKLAKEFGLSAERFVAMAYLAYEYCDGTKEETESATKRAMYIADALKTGMR
jgi:hypothetical protein